MSVRLWSAPGVQKIFGNSKLAITDTVNESRIIIHGITYVDLRTMTYQDLRCFYVVVGGSHMKRGDVLTMDVRVRARFEKDR